MTKLVALDIETLDLDRATALVFEIGISVLTLDDTMLPIGEVKTFEHNLGLVEQIAYGRTISPNTVAWHIKQHGGNRAEFEDRLARGGNSSIQSAYEFCNTHLEGADEIWINGLSFDPVVLHYLFAHIGKEPPWHFRKENDVRTIRRALPFLGEAEAPGNGKKRHFAGTDAEWNIEIAYAYRRGLLQAQLQAHHSGSAPSLREPLKFAETINT